MVQAVVAWSAPCEAAAGGPAGTDAARALERAGVDLLVLEVGTTARLDPVPVLSAVARATDRIGLVAALPVAEQPPFLLARALGTLDHVSRGRSGWLVDERRPSLVVQDDTGRWQDAAGCPDAQWAEAVAEHVDVACALWDSWDADAVVADRVSGRFVDHTRVRPVHAQGRYFRSRGPLNNPRPPQGRPVLVGTATSTPAGVRLPAARVDVVVVRAADAAAAAGAVAAVRRHTPAPVLVAVLPDLPGAPVASDPARPAVPLTGPPEVVTHLGLQLLAGSGADGLVLCAPLDPRTASVVAGDLLPRWREAGALGPAPRGGFLRDRLLAVAAGDPAGADPVPGPVDLVDGGVR